ncbi:MAG: formylglycine-generating enzyme family protein, partial [Planctomycetota bacterium]
MYDMHGNVFEWCSDYYDKDYYSNSTSVDPRGPLSEVPLPRSLRGGSWTFGESYLRCSERYTSGAINRCNFVGFRVVGCQLEPDVEPDRGPERPEVATEEPGEAVLPPKPGDAAANSSDMKLIYIPAGSFMMGSSGSAGQLAREFGGRYREEFPQHEVRISKGFWMGQTEVTQGQYKSVMDAQPWSGRSSVLEDANHPAVYVTWDDAVEFCRKLSLQEGKAYRLPTEAEWEYACRAGTTTRYGFGDNEASLGDYAWCRRNTFEVGQKYAHSV